MIDVFIIDAKNNTCKKDRIKDNLKTFYEIIDTDSIEILTRYINGVPTQIICDEEGKLKKTQYISGISTEFNENLVGNLIIKSRDNKIPELVEKYGLLPYSLRGD